MTSPALPLDGFRPSPRADRRLGSGVGLGTFVSCLLHAVVLAPWLLTQETKPPSPARPVLVEMLALPPTLPPIPVPRPTPSPSAAAAEPVAPPPDLPTLAPAAQASEPAPPAPSPPPSTVELAAAAVPHPIAAPSRPLSRPHPPTVPASADRARRPARSAAPPSPVTAPVATAPAAAEAAPAAIAVAPPPPTPPAPAELPVLRHPAYREPPAAPIYPPQAKRLEQEGTVLLRIRIDTAGDPQDVRIFDGSGFDLLDQAALRAARQWRFQPARRDGHPIPAWVEIPVRFRLS